MQIDDRAGGRSTEAGFSQQMDVAKSLGLNP
jgi:hypothetical protein